MPSDPIIATSIKVGVPIISRLVPKGYQIVTQWWRGKKLLIVGQPRSGKTSLLRYMRFGSLVTKPGSDTRRTLANKKSEAFTIAVGKEATLKLEVGTVVDSVGQSSAREQAFYVGKYRPHTLLVMFDLSSDWDGESEYQASFYAEDFASHLADKLRASKGTRKRLRHIIIILNKLDRVKPAVSFRWKKDIRAILKQHLAPVLGSEFANVDILECSLLKKFDDGELASALVHNMALFVAEN